MAKKSAPQGKTKKPVSSPEPWKWKWADTLIRVGVPMETPDGKHEELLALFHDELHAYAKELKDLAEERCAGKLRVEILQTRLEELP